MPHELPVLPYAYDALEPWIDEATVRLHHDKHHAGYVAGLNKAESDLAAALASGNYGAIKAIEKDLAFHGSGHVLHTLYWETLGPNAGGEPTGDLAAQIVTDFGEFSKFKALFSAAAAAVEGSGWAVLGWDRSSGRLRILQSEKHQDLAIWGVIPLLVCDVWEHAYYLQYQNRRADHIAGWWNVVNWAAVQAKLDAAR